MASYPVSANRKSTGDKPQGWKVAQDEKKGTSFPCRRNCGATFTTFVARKRHEDCKGKECPKYEEVRDYIRETANVEIVPQPLLHPIVEEPGYDVEAEIEKAFFALLKSAPTFEQIGCPAQLHEQIKRSAEWKSKREERERGEKVVYSWQKPKNKK